MSATRDSLQNTQTIRGCSMEDSLMDHVSPILNLLNVTTHKDNMSSAYLVERLDYLRQRLDDFLCPKMLKSEAKSSEPQKLKTEDTGVLNECGFSNSPLTMYNGDQKLSMDLHRQEEIHQRALSEVDGKYIDKNGAEYYNSVHNIDISMKCVDEHVRVIHNKKESETAKNSWSKIPVEWKSHEKFFVKKDNGSLFCKPCARSVDNNVLLHHLCCKRHTAKCKQNPTKKKPEIKDIWFEIPHKLKSHKKFFVKNDNASLKCILCAAIVNDVADELLEHLISMKHTAKYKFSMGKQKIKDVWSKLPQEFQEQKTMFQSHESDGLMVCKVCNTKIAICNKSLGDHLRGRRHAKHTMDFMILNKIVNDTHRTLCDVVTTNECTMNKHTTSSLHKVKLQVKEEDRVWSFISEYKGHRKYFVNLGDGEHKCIMCGTNVTLNSTSVREHICSDKHITLHIGVSNESASEQQSVLKSDEKFLIH